jgi:Protein of unknown function (DUF3040)
MGLTTRERHALYSIENGIAGSDPRLASMLAMFTRLAASEVLPAGENIRAGRLRSGLRWQYAWGMVWLITSVALIAVALAVGHAGGKGTCPVRAAACAGQFVGHIAW